MNELLSAAFVFLNKIMVKQIPFFKSIAIIKEKPRFRMKTTIFLCRNAVNRLFRQTVFPTKSQPIREFAEWKAQQEQEKSKQN